MSPRDSRAAWFRLGPVIAWLVVLASGFVAGSAPSQSLSPRDLAASCPASLVANGNDYHGLTLTKCNFNGRDLSNASFAGATLTAVVFINANLTGADFSGATIADSGARILPTDFSFSNLTRAKFIGTRFTGRTYLTHATLTCADFSGTDLGQGTAIFGDLPLIIDGAQPCQMRFQQATMNCEFIAQWNQFDLTQARIGACAALLRTATGAPGHDFSGATMPGVVFDGIDLSRSKWNGALLTGASFQGATLDGASGLAGTQASNSRLSLALFNNASLKNVDLSYAQLYGANFTYADLENANLRGAFLSNNPNGTPPVENPANFTGAHLKNVNLMNAQLRGAIFNDASFYGGAITAPPAICGTDVASCPNPTGGTCDCATASGADLTRAKFANAFVYGVDFSGKSTTVNGTDFSGAVLVSANFSGATWSVDPGGGGAPPILSNAYLQGTDLHDANLKGAVLTGAYVDLGAPANTRKGNIIALKLGADYARFRNWPPPVPPASGVCVLVSYRQFSLLPPTVGMTCPDGIYRAGGCGALTPDNTNWKGGSLGSAASPGYYVFPASFDAADPANPACNITKTTKGW